MSTFYGPKGSLTVGELREKIANIPDHYTVFVDEKPLHFDVDSVVVDVVCQPDGAACIQLNAVKSYPNTHPDDIIDELEDRIEVLNDCMYKIEQCFKDPMTKEVAEVYNAVTFYTRP